MQDFHWLRSVPGDVTSLGTDLSQSVAGLTVSDQHQGGLVLGFAVVDLNGVGALIGPGEVLHCHLDHAGLSIVADLLALGRDVCREKYFILYFIYRQKTILGELFVFSISWLRLGQCLGWGRALHHG